MAIDLNTLILKVRMDLSNVPTEHIDDSQILLDLQKASDFLDLVLADGVTEAQRSRCLIVLGTYYAYVNYISLAERQLGNFPQASYIRLQTYRQIAFSFISPLSRVPLDADLSPNEKALSRSGGIAFAITHSTLDA